MTTDRPLTGRQARNLAAWRRRQSRRRLSGKDGQDEHGQERRDTAEPSLHDPRVERAAQRGFARAGRKSDSDVAADVEKVRKGFFDKFWPAIGRLPFAVELLAAYYCMIDRDTPVHVKGIVSFALLYFLATFDVAPDFVLGIGFLDDAGVLALAINSVREHVTEAHYAHARDTLGVK